MVDRRRKGKKGAVQELKDGTIQKTMGGGNVTFTQVPATDHQAAGTSLPGTSWDDFAGYPFRQKVTLYWRANPGLQDFLLYILFVLVFSIVSFETKPGEVQFYINNMHRQNFGPVSGIVDHLSLYKWLKHNFSESAFPMYNPGGEPWDDVARLSISGQARVLGAMRLRQVRSTTRECKSIDELKTAEGTSGTIICDEDYTFSTRSKDPIHLKNSTEWADLLDFTRPFEYQTASELNTTMLLLENGKVDSYYQDGYALDIVPNVAPNVLASYVSDCEGIMNQSIAKCMLDQNVFIDSGLQVVPSPPAPAPPPISSNEEPVIVIFTDAGDNGEPTEYSFLLERTIILSISNPEQEVSFQLFNNGVLSAYWELFIYNSTGDQLERWQEDVLWLSEDLNDVGYLECSALNCDPVRFTVTIKAGQVNYLLTDSFVLAGEMVHAPNSPLDIVFRGQSPWQTKQSTLRLNVFLDRTASEGRRLLGTEGGPAAVPAEVPVPHPSRHLQQVIGDPVALSAACLELNNLHSLTPAALATDQCLLVPDDLKLCKLDYVSYQQLYELASPDRCYGCKCAKSTDERCVESCSAKALFIAQVEELEKGAWLDRHTRAVVIDVNLFNANYNLFTNMRIVTEFQPTGYVQSYIRTRTFKLFRYQVTRDYIIGVFEILFILFILYYLYQESVEIYRQGFTYFRYGWNYVDWVNLGICTAVVCLRIISLVNISRFTFNSSSVEYIDFPPIGSYASAELNISAINFFLIYFKIFKYLNHVPRMNSILETLSVALIDLALFLAVVVILYIGFSAAFYVCFGHELSDFRTMFDSVGALNRLVLGDYDYSGMNSTNPMMSRLLFYPFVLIVVFVVLSMFLALINDAYAEVKANAPNDTEIIGMLTNRLFKRQEDVKDLVANLNAANTDADEIVSREELETALRGNTRALAILEATSIEELMAKYDVDDDGELSKDEVLQILAELAEKEADIVDVIQDKEEKMMGLDDEAERALGPSERAAKKNETRVKSYHNRLDTLTGNIKELSKNIAKKLSTMIDLMVSLSEQVSRDINSDIAPPPWAR